MDARRGGKIWGGGCPYPVTGVLEYYPRKIFENKVQFDAI